MLVKIFDGKRSTYRYRNELGRLGFYYTPQPSPHWYLDVSEDRLCEVEAWCFKRKLSIVMLENERSSNYRKTFFDENTGNWREGKYQCVYCGRRLRKEQVSVDHLISVRKTQCSKHYLKLLRKVGFETVNDVRNLVPACKRCNSRKGSKGGWWIVRGLLGRHREFWAIVWSLEGLLVVLCLYTVMVHGFG